MFYDGTEWGTLSFTRERPDAPTIGTASAAVMQKPQFHLQPHQVMEVQRLLPTQLPQAQEVLQEQLSQSGSGSYNSNRFNQWYSLYLYSYGYQCHRYKCGQCSSNSVTTTTIPVGDFYGGGVVFYIFQIWRYMVMLQEKPTV